MNKSASLQAKADEPTHGISFAEAVRVWLRVAALSFGGPAGQIAVMHRILVDEKRWIGEARFLYALSYCMLLPGPEAQQLAIYIGWGNVPIVAALFFGLKAAVLAIVLNAVVRVGSRALKNALMISLAAAAF